MLPIKLLRASRWVSADTHGCLLSSPAAAARAQATYSMGEHEQLLLLLLLRLLLSHSHYFSSHHIATVPHLAPWDLVVALVGSP
jgi:hypothetical protein